MGESVRSSPLIAAEPAPYRLSSAPPRSLMASPSQTRRVSIGLRGLSVAVRRSRVPFNRSPATSAAMGKWARSADGPQLGLRRQQAVSPRTLGAADQCRSLSRADRATPYPLPSGERDPPVAQARTDAYRMPLHLRQASRTQIQVGRLQMTVPSWIIARATHRR